MALDRPSWLRPRRIARIVDGRLLTGYASQHNLRHARLWRTILRIKRRIGAAAHVVE